jgi:hypothetical protein
METHLRKIDELAWHIVEEVQKGEPLLKWQSLQEILKNLCDRFRIIYSMIESRPKIPGDQLEEDRTFDFVC